MENPISKKKMLCSVSDSLESPEQCLSAHLLRQYLRNHRDHPTPNQAPKSSSIGLALLMTAGHPKVPGGLMEARTRQRE